MNDAMDPRLQLVAPSAQARLLMFALCVLLPLLILAGSLSWTLHSGAPLKLVGGSVATTVMATLGGISAATLPVWFFLDRAMRRQRLLLSANALELKSIFYSRSVPLSEIELDKARMVDLHERGDFTPAGKSHGYGIAGYKSGHFRLRNGEKAFVAIAGERRALWLPTTTGPGLLLQPRQPDALLRHLRELAATGARR